eukprot:CAMPEP_0113665124 /NCGR_PEP_ID=MMETSP0038_2-20120614/2126_1 /TAXON_ID=2898 /ORGANISM="Cryptomonas paramecium" /LENGTH=104 /DNA_ID=CAMNT_0000580433 /DNA_START=232 /DNA_END=543 /DNA_ORIENTATION=+ /assembly_acc=CAM_ASM_000170
MELLENLCGISASVIKPGLLLVATDSFSTPPSESLPAMFQVLFAMRRAHWARSVYLITETECGPDGQLNPGDSVKGVNLTRQVDFDSAEAFYTAHARDLLATLA